MRGEIESGCRAREADPTGIIVRRWRNRLSKIKRRSSP
jgi:hypothetical protein